MFHILNGDSTAGLFRKSKINGSMIPWWEILMEGPVSNYKNTRLFWKKRNEFLEDTFLRNSKEYQREPLDLIKIHSNLDPDEEIVLWFDTDLFCQINLLFLIYWFHENTYHKLSLVCPQNDVAHKDTFRLGMSPHENYPKFLQQKREITEDEKDFAAQIWKAYAGPKPQNIIELLHSKNTPYPHLQNALKLHLLRFPSMTNGLNVIQIKFLNLISDGHHEFIDLIKEVLIDDVIRSYGIGDWQVVLYLKEMQQGKYPLVNLNGLENTNYTDLGNYYNTNIDITPLASEILSGQEDWINVKSINRWLGGILLSGNQCWRWDEKTSNLVYK